MKTLKRLTMRQACFYRLYRNRKDGVNAFIPVHEFMGEVHCVELDLWGFVSHECSARMSGMRSENPNLLEYQKVKTRAGGYYYAYRIKPDAPASAIIAEPERALYDRLKLRERNARPVERCEHGVPLQAVCPNCPQ